MAIHFSEEEQERLEKNKAEIYKKRTKETNQEDIRNLSWKGKLKQFRDYYLKGVVIGIIIIALVGVQIWDVTHKESVELFISIQGDAINDNQIEQIEDQLNEYLGLRKGKETVRISIDSDIHQIQTYLYTGTTDILIAPKEDFENWAKSGYFFAQNGNKEVGFYQDYPEEYRVYSKIISGEDVRENTTDTEIEPSDPTEYYCGVSLKDSKKYRQIGGMVKEPVIGINCESKHVEEAVAFLKYMMDNSKTMTDLSKN